MVEGFSFTKRGNKVEITQIQKKEALSDRNVLDELDGIQKSIQQNEHLVKESEQKIKTGNESIAKLKEWKKEYSKFEEWALTLQKSKLKAFVEKYHDEAMKEVAEKSKDNPGLTEEHKANQDYVIYQNFIARRPEVAQEIAPRIIQECMYVEPIFDNPFKKD